MAKHRSKENSSWFCMGWVAVVKKELPEARRRPSGKRVRFGDSRDLHSPLDRLGRARSDWRRLCTNKHRVITVKLLRRRFERKSLKSHNNSWLTYPPEHCRFQLKLCPLLCNLKWLLIGELFRRRCAFIWLLLEYCKLKSGEFFFISARTYPQWQQKVHPIFTHSQLDLFNRQQHIGFEIDCPDWFEHRWKMTE